MESKEQNQTEDLAGLQAHHHELQILLLQSLDEYQTKFRDEHNEITKAMKDLSIIQHQAELEEKTGNEQQLRKELSMVAQDNDAKHGDVDSRQEARILGFSGSRAISVQVNSAAVSADVSHSSLLVSCSLCPHTFALKPLPVSWLHVSIARCCCIWHTSS